MNKQDPETPETEASSTEESEEAELAEEEQELEEKEDQEEEHEEEQDLDEDSEAEAVDEADEAAADEGDTEAEAVDEVDEIEEEPRLPDFGPGDTVKVQVRVKEGERERMQAFEGIVISIRGSRENKTFTVRKISFGVGVERIFPLNSPVIANLEIISRGDVRKAKLYYLRDRVGKAARVKQKRER